MDRPPPTAPLYICKPISRREWRAALPTALVDRAPWSRPFGFDPRADQVSLAGGTRTTGRLHLHSGAAITAHCPGALFNRSRDCTRFLVPPFRRRYHCPSAGASFRFHGVRLRRFAVQATVVGLTVEPIYDCVQSTRCLHESAVPDRNSMRRTYLKTVLRNQFINIGRSRVAGLAILRGGLKRESQLVPPFIVPKLS